VTVSIQQRSGGGYGRPATLSRVAGSGHNSIFFSGHLRGRALSPGSYRATFVASRPGASSVPTSLRFRIVAARD
jgi:hypothetical protein